MKLDYDSSTDSLYIKLKEAPGFDAEEIAEGFVVDFDADGNAIGIDIEHASQKLDLRELEVIGISIPVTVKEHVPGIRSS